MLGWIVLVLLGSTSAGADSAYTAASSTGLSSPCASLQQVAPPPAPPAVCSGFRVTYGALAAYSRDAFNTCAKAQGNHAGGAALMQAVITRNAQPVQASFPAQGSRISSNCVTYLDDYQSFTYALTGAVRDTIHAFQKTSAEIPPKAAGATK